MKKLWSLILVLFTLFLAFLPLGWPKMADAIQWLFRALSIACGLAILILLPIAGRFHIQENLKIRKWRRIPSGTIISETETKTTSGPIAKITTTIKKL